ncbi:MAG: hypothetical protein EA350_03235 [Gemmatimonadales bacterium]|nr:MAG: hypothetical protein EA350_03235 [Gemmatimonadales bacterium]
MGGRAGGRAGVSESRAGDGTDRTAATDRANDADRTAATDRANDAAHTAGADRADRRADRRGDPHTAATDTDSSPPAWDPLDAIIEELAEVRSGVVMTMGKGGVGKTTVAARIALGLARRGLPVTLTTTDPAAHVEAAARGLNLELALELELDLDRDRDAGADPGTGAGTGASSLDLRITRIDPQLETRRYSEEVLRTAGADLDAQGRALLEEDLRSPCTEEIAVFRAFADTVAGGADRFVVIDTAPTGHTLLLLDAAEAYHREVLRKPSGSPDAVLQLLPRLRDPSFTHLLLVTLPEATPIHEAMQLERDLARADITPSAWVVNQSLTPLAVTDPVLLSRQAAEALHLEELGRHAGRIVLEPWEAGPGTGTMTVGGGSVPAALA